MSAHAKLARIHQQARVRGVLIAVLRWLPWLAIGGYCAWHIAGAMAGVTTVAIAALLLSDQLANVYRQRSRAWLIRRLDTQDRALDDSSDLVFADSLQLAPLQRIQRARVEQRINASSVDLREPIPAGNVLRIWLAAALCGLALWLWHAELIRTPATETSSASHVIEAPQQQSMTATLAVIPPVYTGLAPHEGESLDVAVAQDSLLRWSLAFAIPPTAVRLAFVGGEALALRETDGKWRGERVVDASALYRIEVEGAEAPADHPPYRIDMRADAAPVLNIIEPQRTLTVLDAAAARWKLSFDAEDDYGLGTAQLLLTLAQGSGEQVTVSERRLALRGVGKARKQRFDYAINLASLGFAQGDDLIARIEVRDQRQPAANIARSASFILRWPAEQSSDGTGVEGLVQKTLPAYFRSQRQIIIDTEALIAERPQLDAGTLLARSDAIGVDQRILRLRYGQFLGEEAEDADEHADQGHEDDEHADDGHHEGTAALGDAAEVIAEFGHAHDIAEAATLLDPGTRKLLRAALGEMWQSELHLRTGEPRAALPFENRALDYIKRVQQASRIYLARVGLELPELDPARRLTGEGPRAGRRGDPLAANNDIAAPMQVWRALQHGAEPPLDALQAWLRSNNTRVKEPLTLLQSIDELQRTPACEICRNRLVTQLWPLLTPPAAAPALRTAADDVGRAYLDALASSGDEP